MRSHLQQGRFTVLMLVASLLLAALALPAQARVSGKSRTASGTYAAASIMAYNCAETEGLGCVRFTPKAGERFIHVEVQDATGMPVYAYVNQDANGDGYSDIDGAICGRTRYPLRIVPHVPVHVFVLPSYSFCPGAVATRGTVEATLGGYEAVRRAASE